MAAKDEIKNYWNGLASPSRKRREATVEIVKSLPPEERPDAIIALLTIDPKAKDNASYRAAAALFAVTTFFVFAIGGGLAKSGPIAAAFFPLIILAWFIASYKSALAAQHLVPKGVFELLGEASDARLVKPLLEAIELVDLSERKRLGRVLADCLPLITDEEAASFNVSERSTLLNQLVFNVPAVKLAVLDILKRGKITAALPMLESVLKRSWGPEIAPVVQDCVLNLQQARDAEKISASLLRPSQSESAPETLLRAAVSANEGDKARLLRPTGEIVE